jgi:uncharacterized protein (DUF488 family)
LSGQLYTIGYQKLTPRQLVAIARKVRAVVIDCRNRPISRRPGWSAGTLRPVLERAGVPYELHGDHLGGRGATTPAGIRFLRAALIDRNLLLLCVEENPEDCHRHVTICGPHFPEAVHIFRRKRIRAGELS